VRGRKQKGREGSFTATRAPLFFSFHSFQGFCGTA
jgi:hypothetical protein